MSTRCSESELLPHIITYRLALLSWDVPALLPGDVVTDLAGNVLADLLLHPHRDLLTLLPGHVVALLSWDAGIEVILELAGYV